MWQKLTPQKVILKKSVKGDDFLSIQDQDGEWYSVFSNAVISPNNFGLFREGNEIEVLVLKKGNFKNIVEIKKTGETQKIESSPFNEETPEEVPLPIENIPYVEIDDAPIPQEDIPDISEEVKKDIKNSDDKLLKEVNSTVRYLHDNGKKLGGDELSRAELQLASLNLELSSKYSTMHKEVTIKSLEFRNKVLVESKKISQENPDMKITSVKEEAENKLWNEKIELALLEEEISSYYTVMENVKVLINAVKDRFKMLNK